VPEIARVQSAYPKTKTETNSTKLVTMSASVPVKGDHVQITGDDILIEYCERILDALTKI